MPGLFGGTGSPDQFGSAYAPWSETDWERKTAFDAAFANKFKGVPDFLQGGARDDFNPLEAAYMFQRGMGNIPANTGFGSFMNNPGNINWNSLINQGANLLGQGAGVGSNLAQGFQEFLGNNQPLQMQMSLASALPGVPGFLANSMGNVASDAFNKWVVGLPQGEAAAGVPGSQLNWLNEFVRRGYRF